MKRNDVVSLIALDDTSTLPSGDIFCSILNPEVAYGQQVSVAVSLSGGGG